MEDSSLRLLADRFGEDGYITSVPILTHDQVGDHRAQLEQAEQVVDGSLHYVDKAHTALASPFDLATSPAVLDVVEALIGPNILLYNSTYIIKEPGSAAKVNWHQDLTYWGLLDQDAQVSMWLALAPATAESGAMMMLPGSHRHGAVSHDTGSDDGNLLLLGQHIAEIDSASAVLCDLEPGHASFHHGWTIHASQPNTSNDRRIGLNVQYLAPHNRLATGTNGSALLVRGSDPYGYFDEDRTPPAMLDGEAIAKWREADDLMKANFQQT